MKKGFEKLVRELKKLIRPVAHAMAACVIIATMVTMPAMAVPSVTGPPPIITSAVTNSTAYVYPNGSALPPGGSVWPGFVTLSTSVSNFTRVDISQYKEVAFQFTMVSTNASSSAAYWTLYKSVQAGTATTNTATNLNLVVLGYVTNTMPGVAGGISTAVATYTAQGHPYTQNTNVVYNSFGGYQSADDGIAGITSIYIGSLTMPAATGVTNYNVYFYGK